MKLATNRLYSLALGLAYLTASPAQAGIDWAAISGYFKKQLFFMTYAYGKLADTSRACEEKPFEIPATDAMPNPEKIADLMAQHINPHTFLRGASTSEHQCSKRCTPAICSWSRFAQERNLAQPTDETYPVNWWDHYREYITYAKHNLHLNAIRFSIEWPLVQPKDQSSFDEEVLKHYADLLCYALEQNITPLICFHHYTDPCWFIDHDGFNNSENVISFVNYCTHTYTKLMSAVRTHKKALNALKKMYPREPLWATFNAPEGYAFRGYHQHQGPPAHPEKKGLAVVANVLKNELEAHAHVYHALKQAHETMNLEQYGIKPPLIGFLKNIHQLDSAKNNWLSYILSPLTTFMCSYADMIQNGSMYSFFTTGTYRVQIPGVVSIEHTNQNAIGTLDFIGLNHYSNRSMFLTQTVYPDNDEVCSDNPVYYRYPQGMYRAIVELSEKMARPLKIPVYVAENGIATHDNEKRYKFYHEYLYAIQKAAQDGYPVHGYFPWTLVSNYEWPHPHEKNSATRDYGLCSVSQDNPAQLTVKKGSASYVAFNDRLSQHTNPLQFIRNELDEVAKIMQSNAVLTNTPYEKRKI